MAPRRRTALALLCLALQLVTSGGAAAGLVVCTEPDGAVAVESPGQRAACCGPRETAIAPHDCCRDTAIVHPIAVRHEIASDAGVPDMVMTPAPPAWRGVIRSFDVSVDEAPPGRLGADRTVVLIL